MSALPLLPVEVWQTILRFSISIAGFLDPDTFEGDLGARGFGDADCSRDGAATYWESERTRNTLQHVCKAWDTYLRCFDHRYVRMVDLWSGSIDEKSIKKATRISFRGDGWVSREVRYPLSGSWSWIEVNNKLWRFCCQTVLALHDLPAEIIDIDNGVGCYLWNSGALRSLKGASVVTISNFYANNIALPLFSQIPSLKHLIGVIHDNFQNLQFISRTLVTFSLLIGREPSYKTLILDLPALRHLRIWFGRRVNPSMLLENILAPFFGKVGGQLQSLHWDRGHQMPVEIWQSCPHLEVFHPGKALPISAPVLHRVHTLSVIPDAMPQALKLHWPELRRLILHGWWSTIHDPERLNELFTLWADKFQGSGVAFEDDRGIALESFMKTRDLIGKESAKEELSQGRESRETIPRKGTLGRIKDWFKRKWVQKVKKNGYGPERQ